jgi:hypothetical protein
MPILAGTNVLAKLVPFSENDTYATHDDFYGAGGLKAGITNALARLAIPAARRKAGMIVYQQDTDDYYKLESDLVTWTNKGPLGGIGGTITLFKDLFDTPSNYVGNADKIVAVNQTEDGLEYQAKPVYNKVFTNADLLAGILTITHNLAKKYCIIQIFDNSDKLISPDDITLTDTNNSSVDLSSFGALAGTWHALVMGVA